MCYQKVHTCKFCHSDYLCELDTIECPTANGDADKNMCNECRKELERKLIEEMEHLND